MPLKSIHVKAQGHVEPKHLWKGYMTLLSCTLNIYLVDNLNNTQSLLVLCDYKGKYNTDYSIDRLTIILTNSEMKALIDSDKLIDLIVTQYLKEEATTRQVYGLTLQ